MKANGTGHKKRSATPPADDYGPSWQLEDDEDED